MLVGRLSFFLCLMKMARMKTPPATATRAEPNSGVMTVIGASKKTIALIGLAVRAAEVPQTATPSMSRTYVPW